MKRAASHLLLAALLLALVKLNDAASEKPDAGTNMASLLAAKLIKVQQTSACDGEQLRIQCNEDYLIEVVQVEYTILTEPQNQSRANSPAANGANMQQQQICQPKEPPSSSSSLSSSTSGNGLSEQTAPLCNQSAAEEAQKVRSESATALVRNECRSMNSCSIQLRWPQTTTPSLATAAAARSTTIVNNATLPNKTTTTTTTTAALMSKLFTDDACASNRKLLEVVYKCRPLKFNRRTACRNSQLQLTCAQDRQLVFITADYGAWANDFKSNERCHLESSRSGAAMGTKQQVANSSIGDTQITSAAAAAAIAQGESNQQLSENCLANTSAVIQTLTHKCLFERTCQMEVNQKTFGNANCPSGQAEYLKLVYICLNESSISPLLRDHVIATTRVRQQHLPKSTTPFAESPSFTSSNISSSLLLNSSTLLSSGSSSSLSSLATITASTRADSPPAGEPIRLPNEAAGQFKEALESTMADQQSKQELESFPPAEVTNFITSNGSNSNSNFQFTTPRGPEQVQVLAFIPNNSVRNWSLETKALFLWHKYHQQAIVTFVASISILVMLVGVHACRKVVGGQAKLSSASASISSSSTLKTSDNNFTGNQSNGTSMFAYSGSSSASSDSHQHQHQQQQQQVSQQVSQQLARAGGHQRQHQLNSCSESCFSLDDFNMNNSNSAESPSNLHTPPIGAEHQPKVARSKMWTIYGQAEPNGGGIGANNWRALSTHNTMRPTRTFVGHQQQHLARNRAPCLHNQAPMQQQPQPQPQQLVDNLLLTTANQQPSAAAMATGIPASASWCARHDQQQQQQQSPIDRSTATLLVNPAQFNQADLQQHADGSIAQVAQQQQQCAFHHHQQQQQQQQQILFTQPAAIQLELPQLSALIASQQQQQQQADLRHFQIANFGQNLPQT